jgi:drug/metabolite transporter (DMT)-like permease
MRHKPIRCFGTTSHYFLIKAYSHLTAVEVQPITYLQLVLSVALATLLFNETLTTNMVIGAIIVVGAGLFTVWREHRRGLIDEARERQLQN